MNSASLPMPPQLSSRCALALLGAMALASAAGVLALGPVAADPGSAPAHRCPQLFGLRDGWSVLLQTPLLFAALSGMLAARRAPGDAMRHAWAAFFAMAALVGMGGAVDQLRPTEGGHVLAKLPAASAGVLLAALFLAERISLAWIGPLALWLALASGPVAGALWLATDVLHGQPDQRLLLCLEYLPFLLVPLGAWGLPSRGLCGRAWAVALLWFAAAALMNWADLAILEITRGAISGHVLHYLPLAGCVAWLAWCVARQPVRPDAARPVGSQRQTSLITSG